MFITFLMVLVSLYVCLELYIRLFKQEQYMTDTGETFIREISLDKITDKLVKEYEDKGFILRWKDDSLEIWCK